MLTQIGSDAIFGNDVHFAMKHIAYFVRKGNQVKQIPLFMKFYEKVNITIFLIITSSQ